MTQFPIGADMLMGIANAKVLEAEALHMDRPDVAQAIATEAVAIAMIANAQATLTLAEQRHAS